MCLVTSLKGIVMIGLGAEVSSESRARDENSERSESGQTTAVSVTVNATKRVIRLRFTFFSPETGTMSERGERLNGCTIRPLFDPNLSPFERIPGERDAAAYPT